MPRFLFGVGLVVVLLDMPVAFGQQFFSPRQIASWDLPYQKAQRVVWSPDGNTLAVSGFVASESREQQLDFRVISDLKSGKSSPAQPLAPGAWLIGFTRDGRSVVTDLRQYRIAHGIHRLTFWDHADGQKSRSIDLDSDRSMWYTFADDDATFRTVQFTEGLNTGANTLKVCDVSTGTGRTVGSVMRLNGNFAMVSLSANGKRLATLSPAGLTEVWDVATGTKAWTVAPIPSGPQSGLVTEIRISQDARLLFVIQDDKPRLFDVERGVWQPELEWTGRLRADAYTANGFSADGKLFVYNGFNRMGSTEVEVLIVWDTTTGRVLKSWDRVAPAAVSPSKPVLAMLQPHGVETRLTLWDFSVSK